MTRALLLAVSMALPLLGCASGPRADLRALQYRSVFDLGCPAQSLQLYHVDRRTKVVAGCGRRLVYVESCDRYGSRRECSWLLDSPVFAQSAWPVFAQSAWPVFAQSAWPVHAPGAWPQGMPAPVPGAPSPAVPVAGADPRPPLEASSPSDRVEGRPIRTDLDGPEQSVIPSRVDTQRPVRTDLFDAKDQASILEHRR